MPGAYRYKCIFITRLNWNGGTFSSCLSQMTGFKSSTIPTGPLRKKTDPVKEPPFSFIWVNEPCRSEYIGIEHCKRYGINSLRCCF